MPTYAALADVAVGEYQNAQELGQIWGDVRADLEDQNCDLLDAYVLLGDRDVLLLIEAPNQNAALQASIAAERYGLDLETMAATSVDELGEIAEDF